MKLRILGDTHGETLPVKGACKGLQWPLVHLGDFGRYDVLKKNGVADKDVRIVGGNHEVYRVLRKLPQYLGDFGTLKETNEVFFIRGAWSIDKQYRMMHGHHWDPEEELTYEQMEACEKLYNEVKPKIVLSHTAPAQIACHLTNPAFGGYNHSRTEEFLEWLWNLHEPEQWYFGHWHRQQVIKSRGTMFRCVGIDEHFDIEV